MCGYCGCRAKIHQNNNSRIIQIERAVLEENRRIAKINRDFFRQHNMLVLNLVSSPGSGKTTLLVNSIKRLKRKYAVGVIEGDQKTDLDACEISALRVPVLQVNTGKSCHLDAHDIYRAVSKLPLQDNSILLIENVGNLVCPAMFDLGETCKIVILSTTEGANKPLKYSYMFNQSELMIINKIDLLPFIRFDMDRCIGYAKKINPGIEIIKSCATNSYGLNNFISWITHKATCKDYT